MDYCISLHRICSSIRNHGPVEFYPLLICRVGGIWLDAIFRRDNCVHPTVSGVAEVPIGMFTHLVDCLSSCRHRPDLRLQFPRTKKRMFTGRRTHWITGSHESW